MMMSIALVTGRVSYVDVVLVSAFRVRVCLCVAWGGSSGARTVIGGFSSAVL